MSATARTVGVDPRRLARAVHLDAEPDGADAWLVSGGAGPHRVTFDGERFDCGCQDRAIRRGGCKHILRVLLGQGHPAVLRALRHVVRSPDLAEREPPPVTREATRSSEGQ